MNIRDKSQASYRIKILVIIAALACISIGVYFSYYSRKIPSQSPMDQSGTYYCEKSPSGCRIFVWDARHTHATDTGIVVDSESATVPSPDNSHLLLLSRSKAQILDMSTLAVSTILEAPENWYIGVDSQWVSTSTIKFEIYGVNFSAVQERYIDYTGKEASPLLGTDQKLTK